MKSVIRPLPGSSSGPNPLRWASRRFTGSKHLKGTGISMKTKDMTIVAVLAAFICVCAPWAIPVGPIPITLATFAVYVVSSTTNWKYGVFSVLLYVLIGAVGLPVFSGFGGGIGKITGVTGGFLIGYIPCSIVTGLVIDRFPHAKWAYPAGMALGTVLCYAFGLAWFIFLTGNTLYSSFLVCVVPFLPGDAIKIAVASLAAYPLRKKLFRMVSV